MEYKEYLERKLKHFQNILEDENKKSSDAVKCYEEAQAKQQKLLAELMELKSESDEYNILDKNISAIDEMVSFFTERIEAAAQTDISTKEIENDIQKTYENYLELGKPKQLMTYDELVKEKEDIFKQLEDIKIKQDSLEEEFETYNSDLEKKIYEFKMIKSNVKQIIDSAGDLNRKSLAVYKKRAQLKSAQEEYEAMKKMSESSEETVTSNQNESSN